MNTDGPSAANARVDAPLFLVGSERSGTTFLRLMLDHHPEIAFEKEFDFVVTKVSDAGEFPLPHDYVEWIATVRGANYAIDRSLGYRELVNDFLHQEQAASGGKPHVGATVHRNFDRLRFLWPDARYIHLVRDPRDVARSVLQKGWAGNIYQASEFWIQAENCWDSLVTHLRSDQAIEIHYEDLVRRNEVVLTEICRFVGVDYSEKMLDYPADAPQYPPPDPSLVAQWKTKLSKRNVALVEVRTGPLMESRGYPPSGLRLPKVGPLKHQLLLRDAQLRRLRTRLDLLGPRLVMMDVLGRRLGLGKLATHAQTGINAVEQRLVDQENKGERAPSANIAPLRPADMREVAEPRRSRRPRVTMLIESNLFPEDTRARDEAHSLVAAGYDVSVIAPRGLGQDRKAQVGGVTAERYWLPMSKRGDMAGLIAEYIVAHAQLFFRGMRSLLGGTDFLHWHNPPDTLFPLAIATRRLRKRFVFDEHDLFPDLFEQRFGRGPLWHIAAVAHRMMIRNADLVLVTNGTHLEDAHRQRPRSGTRIVLVRNGPRQSTVSGRLPGIRPGALADPKLLYVGALEPQDGGDQLPEILERLVVDHGLKGARLTVAGWGTELETMRADFASRGLLERVQVLGRIPHVQVLRLVADADICLDPAPCNPFNHAATMIKISEYLALGRPTVSYALHETDKTAAGAVSLVPCGDLSTFARRVAELAGSEEARAELHRRAMSRAPDLVWEHQAASLIDAYDDVARRDGLKP